MKLRFSIEYGTVWGQVVCAEICLTRINGTLEKQLCYLTTGDGYHWLGEIYLADKDLHTFEYTYIIVQDGQVVRREWHVVPRCYQASPCTFVFPDHWLDVPKLNYAYSAAYTNCISHFEPQKPEFVYFDRTLLFRVQAPLLRPGQALALLGSQPLLGGWDSQRAIRMQKGGVNEWFICLNASGLYLPFEYKYVVIDERSGNLIQWEEGNNRQSPSGMMQENEVVAIYNTPLRMTVADWKAAGLVVPVFSLRSEQSQGVGDFSDLRRMVEWAYTTGMRVVQILPIYDTTQSRTWKDSYPYNGISIYAFHPMYIDLHELPSIQDEDFMRTYETERLRLNALPQVEYEGVNRLKESYLRHLYAQEFANVRGTREFRAFYSRNKTWLLPYMAFCLLRDTYGTSHFDQWPSYSEYQQETIHALLEERLDEAEFYAYEQYLLHVQLSQTAAYARAHGVVLKGDIPIGISRYSVEAWSEPYYFHMDGQAGAPPDDFSVNGQNWGFPTYNWDVMCGDGCQWWIRRLQKMAEYFDAFRIDHVLGFFRIWEIPTHSVHGLLGHFSPSLPMRVEEIEQYGLHFDADRFTQPYITDAILDDLFGVHAKNVKRKCLTAKENGTYQLKPAFATQQQVQAAFEGLDDEASLHIRDGLYSLISDVLFVRDPKDPSRYHPRIGVLQDYVFQDLSIHEQKAFRSLYEQYYYHRHDAFWYAEAMKKLPLMLDATRMMACAEDLGMVPSCVGTVMEQLKMLSLEIQAMPKAFGSRFGRLNDNPYYSVATIFTHDMPTLRGWWEEDPIRSQQFYEEALRHEGTAPRVLTEELAKEIVMAHLACPSMLCLISLQDWLAMSTELRYEKPEAERINVPACPRHYWRYRMHLTIEELQQATEFNSELSTMIKNVGR